MSDPKDAGWNPYDTTGEGWATPSYGASNCPGNNAAEPQPSTVKSELVNPNPPNFQGWQPSAGPGSTGYTASFAVPQPPTGPVHVTIASSVIRNPS